MERTDKLNQLRQFNRPWEYDCCDIAEKLVELSNLPDDGQLKNELTDALYYLKAVKLHDEEIEGHSFTACPACGKDVVEGLSRAEFEDEYFRPRYSVVVRQFSGSVRGYIVSANSRHEVMKRLLEKLDFNYVAEVSIGEILVKEDEF